MPPTEKQIRYAVFLSKKTNRELPDNWRVNRDICGAFIASAKRQMGGPKGISWTYTDDNIRRIESGGPLKNEPGPWDEAWCATQ